jgi:hypothetical protein
VAKKDPVTTDKGGTSTEKDEVDAKPPPPERNPVAVKREGIQKELDAAKKELEAAKQRLRYVENYGKGSGGAAARYRSREMPKAKRRVEEAQAEVDRLEKELATVS